MSHSRTPDVACRTRQLDITNLAGQLAAPEVSGLAGALASAIKALPARRRPMHPAAFLASYRYGDGIWSKNGISSPCRAAARRSCDACQALETALNSQSAPLTMVIRGSVEVAMTIDGATRRYVPLRVLAAGDFFGIFETLDQRHAGGSITCTPWDIVAGSRAIQILAPLNDSDFKDALTYDLSKAHVPVRTDDSLPLKSPVEHWRVIQKLAMYLHATDESFELPSSEVLFFSRDLTVAVLERPDVALDLFDVGWDQTAYMRSAMTEDATHRSRFLARDDAKRRDAMFLYSSIRHVMAIRAGRLPGMVPLLPDHATPEDTALLRIQEDLDRRLSTTKHRRFPHIIRPRHMGETHPVAYYSLRHCHLPAPILWDLDPAKAPGIWRRLAFSFVAMAIDFELEECLAPIAITATATKTRKKARANDEEIQLRRSWSLVNNDFQSNALPSTDRRDVYQAAEFWSACIRITCDD